MGDERRDQEFARFIKRNWPKVHSVLVVADGKGRLARRLANAFFQTRIIDPDPRLVGRQHDRIVYQGYQQWLKKLKRLGQAYEKSLRFSGRNIVLYRK